MEIPFYVYEHWRPDLNTPFLVGKGSKGRAFVLDRKSNPYHRNIYKKLHRLGLQIEVRIIDQGLTEAEAFALERVRIAYWRSQGVRLANMTDGGEGASGRKLTKEQSIAQSVRQTGKKQPNISKALKGLSQPKISQALKGRKRPPRSLEWNTKISISKAGKKVPALSKAKKGKVWSNARRAAGNNIKTLPRTQAHNQAVGDALRGKEKSPEHCAAISASKLGKPWSEKRRAAFEAKKRSFESLLT